MKNPLLSAAIGLLVSACSVWAQTLPGDVLYSTDFTGPNGSTPTDWTGVAYADIMEIQSNNYRFRRHDASSSAFFRSSAYDGEGASSWDNYSVNTSFQVSHESNNVGIVARWDGSVPTNNSTVVGGYLGYVFISGQTRQLRIQSGFQRSNNISQTGSTLLASVDLDDALLINTVYQLHFELAGAQLKLDLLDSSGGLLATVSAVNSDYITGGAGLASYMSYHSRQTLFHDFEVIQAIPEPATLGLLGGVTLLGLAIVARKRRKL